MAGVTSLPVRVKFWRGAGLSGPAIMVCTNVLVSQSKHSKSCYLLSFSLLLSNSASLFFSWAKLSTERRSSFKWETEKGWMRRRRRRRETGRRDLHGEREEKVKQRNFQILWTIWPASCICVCPCMCRKKGLGDEMTGCCSVFRHTPLLPTAQTTRCISVQTVRGGCWWGSVHHVVGILQLIMTVGLSWRYWNDLCKWISVAVRSSNW